MYANSLFIYASLMVLSFVTLGCFIGSLLDYFLATNFFNAFRIKWEFLAIGVAMLVCLVAGYSFGKENTISKAELLETNDNGYTIMYGDEDNIHEYDW